MREATTDGPRLREGDIVTDSVGAVWYVNGDGAEPCAVCWAMGRDGCHGWEQATLWRIGGDGGQQYHVCESQLTLVARGARWGSADG